MAAAQSAPLAPITTVAGAIARMEAIEAAAPAGDGLACFNRMYLQVTQQVNSELGAGFFADPHFMGRLDVTFANFYFAAINASATPGTGPLAWRPLIEQRNEPGIEPIQFALAGMNAHINHDLPLAVVATCTDVGSEPSAGTHLADYKKVDQLLDAAEQSVRQAFENSPELALDQHMQAVSNLVGNWAINSARDLAWTNALLLWELRTEPVARDLFLDSLAATTAAASRLLLVAV